MAYGGRAYDDDKPWWKEEDEDDVNTSSKPTNPSQRDADAYDDFDSPPPTQSQPDFHGKSSGNSYGVYNAYGNSAYDDHNQYQSPTNNAAKQEKTEEKPSTDAYDAITKKSKYNRNTQHSKKLARTKQRESAQSGISNPSYRNIRNLRNQTQREERARPELHTMEQKQSYKQVLRDKTIGHLDQSLATAYKSEELAADTNERLYYQRKQLENVDQMLHETDQNLDRTEHTLKGMKSIWGGMTNYFKRAPERQPYEKRKATNHTNATQKMMQFEKEKARKGYRKQKNISLGGSKECDDEFNDKLDELHKSVQRMKLMAQSMNEELDDQSGLLGGIDDKMGKVDSRIHRQNHTMKRIR